MTADDLTAPLGRQPRGRRRVKLPALPAIAGALALFLAVFVLWAVVADDPFGGEPMAVIPANIQLPAKPDSSVAVVRSNPIDAASNRDLPTAGPSPGHANQQLGNQSAMAAPNTTTITIIDGKTGEHHDVVVPSPNGATAAAVPPPVDPKFVEMTPHGPVPRIAADGVRPADAFARPVQPLPGKPDAPRVGLIVDGLGVSANATADAIAKLPGAVTLGFIPYGNDVAALAIRARAGGHEILLQVPMEPFNYPDNDPGPQTLLTTLTPPQNIDRLYTLMGRLQGYVGLTNTMGAKFTASEDALAPILRETAKRGLIYVDDGTNPRSIAGRIAGANNLPFVHADVVLDSVPTPIEIDKALDRLEMMARERSFAVGVSSALPVSIEHIAAWAKAAEGRGLLLVPISAIAARGKQT
jgi:polysaccharide deacetylase 2 family uncharacterized protein YibQ